MASGRKHTASGKRTMTDLDMVAYFICCLFDQSVRECEGKLTLFNVDIISKEILKYAKMLSEEMVTCPKCKKREFASDRAAKKYAKENVDLQIRVIELEKRLKNLELESSPKSE